MNVTWSKIKEEFDRHMTFSKGFFAIIVSVIIPLYFVFSYYKIGATISAFIMYFISAIFPDAFFVFMAIIDPKKRGLRYWRNVSHRFSSSIVYFFFVTFLLAPLFRSSCFLIGFLSLISYWIHLLVDKIEIIELEIQKILNTCLSKVFK